MAINYTVSFTFTANTTIASAQVNTNFSDNSNTWTGLEALTKTFAKLKVDVDPATVLEVATKQYVDHYAKWRRPNLQYNSGSVVNVETGLDGTSGDCVIQFPAGDMRTDTATGRIQCNLAQNAVLSGTAQSGLDTGSVTANKWYNFYAVKTSDNASNFVIVASLINPTQANKSTLDSNLGTNSYLYLGTLPYGDGNAATTAIPTFKMAGNTVSFTNASTGNGAIGYGVRLATTAGATTLTWTYAAGSALGSGQTPSQLTLGSILATMAGSTSYQVADSGATLNLVTSGTFTSKLQAIPVYNMALSMGAKVTPSGSQGMDIFLTSYTDGVLGVGSNPFL